MPEADCRSFRETAALDIQTAYQSAGHKSREANKQDQSDRGSLSNKNAQQKRQPYRQLQSWNRKSQRQFENSWQKPIVGKEQRELGSLTQLGPSRQNEDDAQEHPTDPARPFTPTLVAA